MLDVLYSKFHDYNSSWDRLVEFLAVDNCPPMLRQIEDKMNWYFSDLNLAGDLIKRYDLSLLKSDRHDYLGDLYVENQSKLGQTYKGQFLTPDPVVEFIVASTIGKTDKKLNVLDPCVGTGRFLIKASEYAPNAELYGVDIDIRALRIAFTNCAIHSVSAYFLCADSLKHNTDFSEEDGRYNWGFANRWYPRWDKLREMRPRKERKEENKGQGKKISKLEGQKKIIGRDQLNFTNLFENIDKEGEHEGN